MYIENPTNLSGEDVLPGFVLDLDSILRHFFGTAPDAEDAEEREGEVEEYFHYKGG